MKRNLLYCTLALLLIAGCTQPKQPSKVEELQKLDELHKSGCLSDDEFSKLKSEIIGETGEKTDKTATEPVVFHECADLGLPSGTLWATTNIGADSPWETGYFYAWGEKTVKGDYSWQNYKFSSGANNTLKKYVTDSHFGSSVDNRISLLDTDDAATSQWGSEWRIPSTIEMRELKEKCKWQWVANKDKTNGYMVTGPNGTTLFFPAAGYIDGTTNNNINSGGFYWSSGVFAQSPDFAMALGFSPENVIWGNEVRSFGLTIRAVRTKKIRENRTDIKNL